MISDNDLLVKIYNCIDNTSLEGSDNSASIENLCCNSLRMAEHGFGHVAAVCVYPVFIKQAAKLLNNSGINVASVAGSFPSGQSPLSVKLSEVQYAVDEGADEIDTVISRGALIEGDVNRVFDELSAIREVAGSCVLKVILETGELSDNHIRQASEIAIKAGADFIKTSTGKISAGATIHAANIMLSEIQKNYKNTGRLVGFKAAGGISTPEQALEYVKLAQSVFSSEYIDKQYFRIGASRLTGKIFQLLTF